MKTAYITHPNYPGVAAVGAHGASLQLWDLFYTNSLPNLNLAYSEIILGAWHPDYQNIINTFKGKITLLWTSSPGQTQFREINILAQIINLLNANKIHTLFFGSKEFYEMFKETPRVQWFPYPFAEELIK